MGSTQFGNFGHFCRDSTLPVCNLFTSFEPGRCILTGIPLHGGGDNNYLRNLGSILICGLAIVLTLALLVLTEKRKASVGRREMQLFLIGYIIISIAEIFSIGGFPLQRKALLVFSAIHVAAITATAWVLMLNGFVAFQYLDDGTVVSIALVLGSAAVLFIGTGYIALDTGFSWTGYFSSSLSPPNRNTGLYVLYLLCTLIFLFVFFIIMAFIVLRTLGERGPMVWLLSALFFFAAGQVFNFVISPYICNGTGGKIDGSLFETLFTLVSVVLIWRFWTTITEVEWPSGNGGVYNEQGASYPASSGFA